ncbi:MAG: iron ABC transporter permease [Planctomycetota bacterium]
MSAKASPSWRRGLFWASVVLMLMAAARLAIGTSGIGLEAGEVGRIFLALRAERLTVAAVVGLALAVSGVSLQALLRNPLAEPYLLGLSTGAAAGMVLAAMLGGDRFGISSGVAGVGGAALTMAIVFALGRRRGVLDPLGVLLVGVVVSTINGAVVLLLSYLSGPGGIRDEVMRWMMGSLSVSGGAATTGVIGGAALLGWAWMIFRGPALDVASLTDEEAAGLGVDVARLRVEAFVIAAALAGGAVVLAGPVAFVGLIAPHLARALCGAAHRGVLIVAGVLGAALLVAADVAGVVVKLASETAGQPIGLIPVGVWTALVGGVSFVVLLRPRLGRGE